MIIAGKRDNVVTLAMSKDLLTQAEKRNASIINDDSFAHPVMDTNSSTHEWRMNISEHFLLRPEKD